MSTKLLRWSDDDGSPERALTDEEYRARLQHTHGKPFAYARHERHGKYARRRVLQEREAERKHDREELEEHRYRETHGDDCGPCWF